MAPPQAGECYYIPILGKNHHVFLEGLEKTKEDRDGVPIYEFLMGS